MKRLIICCDGTWNMPDPKVGKVTNVVKMARAVKSHDSRRVPQVVYYDKGVGTDWGPDKLRGGLLGLGLEENLVQAYRFLVHNYQEGDAIFIFGFSRGAYTVRSLIGFIQHFGLLLKSWDYYTPKAFDLYRQRPVGGAGDTAWKEQVAAFRHDPVGNNKERIPRATRDIPVCFVGVWDTVGSLGIPIKALSFLNSTDYHDCTLCPCIQNAYHALAIDEHREPFAPTLWDEPAKQGQVLEQRWFAGVHSNQGGGYGTVHHNGEIDQGPRHGDGMANISLQWISQKAMGLGLELDLIYLRHFRPWVADTFGNEMTWYYRILGSLDRAVKQGKYANEAIDPSVFELIRYSDPATYPTVERRLNDSYAYPPYRPANLRQLINAATKLGKDADYPYAFEVLEAAESKLTQPGTVAIS